MLFADWVVRIVKNCDWGLENTAWSCPKPVNNIFIFSKLSNEKKLTEKKRTHCDPGQRKENPDRAKKQSDYKIRYRARLGKNKSNTSIFPGLYSLILPRQLGLNFTEKWLFEPLFSRLGWVSISSTAPGGAKGTSGHNVLM